MMRSLYSGISGLKNHQTRMDVIGNNIANVNTVGYKTSRVVFQDIFSQTVKSGSANILDLGRNLGGTNPTQIGLGIKLSTVDVLHTPAPITRTDNPFDAQINGDGFFILQDQDSNFYYTRAGNFYLDDQGYLVSSHGYFVMAYGFPEDDGLSWGELTHFADGEEDASYDPKKYGIIVPDEFDFETLKKIRLRWENEAFTPGDPYDPDIGPEFVDLVGFSIGNNGDVNVIINNVSETIAYLGIAMFSNPAGLDKAGNSLYRESPSSGAVVETLALKDGAGNINGGGLEMANVDLATEFTDMIVTQRGFQANSRVITVSDTLLEELVNLKR